MFSYYATNFSKKLLTVVFSHRKLHHVPLVANLSSRSQHLYDNSPVYVRLFAHARRAAVPFAHVWRQPDAHLQHQHNQQPHFTGLVAVCF